MIMQRLARWHIWLGWLAAIPLLSVVVMLWGDWLSGDLGPYLIGTWLLAGAAGILHARGVPLFVEQLAVPALLVGLGSLGYGLGDDLPRAWAMALLGALSLALAWVLPRPWLRVLLGAAGAGLLTLALMHALAGSRDLLVWYGAGRTWAWVSLHGALAAWLAGLWVQRLLGRGATASAAAALEPIGAGWLLATLAGLAWFLPSLGGVWLALVIAATTGRLGLATTGAFAAAWIIGAFYYQLAWPLTQKALVLAAVGVLLGALVWLGAGLRPAARGVAAGPGSGLAPWLIGLTALGTLGVANLGIWQKENLIAQGRSVFLELAPVDPRSLMQGDSMRLRFRLPAEVDDRIGTLAWGRPQVVARCDDRGVASLLRLRNPGEPLAEGEFPIALTPKDGGWTVATDAWFFREGDAERWQAARYGEFRVTPDGQALLVGMADGELRPIEPRD